MRRFGKRAFFAGLSGLVWALVAACGGSPPCVSSALCPDGAVCGADGTCAAIDPGALRFSRSVWLTAMDWGATARQRLGQGPIPDTDLLLIGGPKAREFYLAFGPLPETGSIAGAALVVAPHATWTPPVVGAEVSVFITRPFRGAELTRRDAPRREPLPAGRTALAGGATRVLRLDLKDAVAAAQRRGAERIYVAISGYVEDPAEGELARAPALRFASPRALRAADRPRLELSVR